MLFAALDIGTNTLRLLIKDSESNSVILRKNYYLLLGRYCESNVLSQEGLHAVRSVLLEIKDLVNRYNISHVFGVATAFARKIKNSQELFNTINSILPCDVRLIDGITEGKIVALAVADWFNLNRDFLVIDVGGSSTEFIYKLNEELDVKSLDVGSLYLTKRFFSIYPPMRKEIDNVIKYLKERLNEVTKPQAEIHCYGVGGTFTTVAFLLSKEKIYSSSIINGFQIRLAELKQLFCEIENLTEEELKMRYPLEYGREKVILAGVIEVMTIMESLKIDKIFASDISLLEGVFSYFNSVK